MIIWSALLVVVVVLSTYVSAIALPRMFLRLRSTITQSNDRCIKRVYEVNGQSLVFEPEEKWRKYINQYILAERGDKKQLICKVAEGVSYLVFDVAVFDAQDKLCDVIRVKEDVDGKQVTGIINLPEDASYVSINIVKADTEDFQDALTGKVGSTKVLKYIFCTFAIVLVESIWIKICLANLYGGIFNEIFIMNVQSLLGTLYIAGALIFVNVVVALISLAVRQRKYKTKVKKNA